MGDVDVYKQEEGDRPVERSPRGRYIRFDIRLGSGAYKTVYKAYDTDQGIDVAWNAIDIGVLPPSEKTRIIQEVQLLQKLEHKNIINFYGSWFSKEKNQVVFITEIMTSGNLKSYIKRVHFIKWKIIKRWCIQILEGLHYLHNQNPPVIHRDLKCDNIFINGNTGDLRIGDLGLSTQLAVHKRSKAQSVLGTPEFMAPELYDESYDEKVDIYAFGMCVLEMVTKEVPYSECINPAHIYKKVTAGIRPRGLQRIVSQAARDFIELCLSRGNGKIDVSAEYLLNHPFLKAQDDDGEMVQVLDDDELERESSSPPPPASPEINPKQFADELNMESGSKGKDEAVVSERRRNNATLSLEPEELATGSANSSMTSPGVAGQLNEPPAEEKSAGKHRVLLPPSMASVVASGNDANAKAAAPAQKPPTIPSGTSQSAEPIVDEPLSDKKSASHNVENFLSGLPPTEANIRNDRIALMGGRGQRIEIDEVTTHVEDGSVVASAPSPPRVASESLSATASNPTATPEGSVQATTAATTTVAPPPTAERPATAAGPAPSLSVTSEQSTVTAGSAVSDSNFDDRPRANTIDQSRAFRPPSATKKPRKRYDIKATKDPDNEHSILLNLRMSLDGRSKEIKFPFNLFTDSAHEVACELAVDVGILEPDLEDIADSISFLATEGKINNLPDFDQDVWDEAPEPHSFPSKPLPHVSKLTFESSAASQALMNSALDGASAVGMQTIAPPALSSSHLVATEGTGKGPSDNNFVVGSPTPFEMSLSPPLGVPHLAHAASETAMYHPEGPTLLEHSMSMGSATDAHYLQTVRQHEDRMKLTRSSYDERKSSLEEAMRTQEEKHQREIERIRMKMQEFNEKTARATMARQERMRLGTDEFRDDPGGESRPANTPPPDGNESSHAPAPIVPSSVDDGSEIESASANTSAHPSRSADGTSGVPPQAVPALAPSSTEEGVKDGIPSAGS